MLDAATNRLSVAAASVRLIIWLVVGTLLGCNAQRYSLNGFTLGESIDSVRKVPLRECSRDQRDLGGYWLTCLDARNNSVELLVFSGSVREINVVGANIRDQFGVSLGDDANTVERIRGNPIPAPNGISYFDTPSIVSYYGLWKGKVATIRLHTQPLPFDLSHVVNCITRDQTRPCDYVRRVLK